MKLLEDLLSTEEIAVELDVSPATVVRWRRKRVGPPYLRIEGRVRYDRKDCRAWLYSKRTEGRAP